MKKLILVICALAVFPSLSHASCSWEQEKAPFARRIALIEKAYQNGELTSSMRARHIRSAKTFLGALLIACKLSPEDEQEIEEIGNNLK